MLLKRGEKAYQATCYSNFWQLDHLLQTKPNISIRTVTAETEASCFRIINLLESETQEMKVK